MYFLDQIRIQLASQVKTHDTEIRISLRLKISVADPGCLSRIRNFSHPGSRIKKIPDPPGSASKNLSILTPKIVSKLLEI